MGHELPAPQTNLARTIAQHMQVELYQKQIVWWFNVSSPRECVRQRPAPRVIGCRCAGVLRCMRRRDSSGRLEARCVFVYRRDPSLYGSISDLVSVSSPCEVVLMSMPQALPVASVRECSDCPPKEKADAGSRSGRIMTRGLRSHSIADYRKWHDTDASMFIWLAGRALCLEHSRPRQRPRH